ncbi:hypothetical protein FQR65_LT09499 [Abscondita terminalis]|nr:hypothetical protein FQR65_LT09499 [Abscondita terminalis]
MKTNSNALDAVTYAQIKFVVDIFMRDLKIYVYHLPLDVPTSTTDVLIKEQKCTDNFEIFGYPHFTHALYLNLAPALTNEESQSHTNKPIGSSKDVTWEELLHVRHVIRIVKHSKILSRSPKSQLKTKIEPMSVEKDTNMEKLLQLMENISKEIMDVKKRKREQMRSMEEELIRKEKELEHEKTNLNNKIEGLENRIEAQEREKKRNN